jgi:uncharacterized protein YgiM (DUF1202 family)
VLNKSIVALLLALFCAGCEIQIRENGATAPTFQIITSTLLPSSTPLPPPATQSSTVSPVAPVEGITSTQLNVRSEPSTVSDVLGILPANTTIQIVGKDPGENWWQILYPEGGPVNEGKGWVTAQYVSTANQPEVPVIGGGGSNPENPNVAVIQQQLNVRSGPGTDFNPLGTLNPQDVVALTGKDSHGAWLQIEFSAGPEGKGWINAAFAQAQGVENLPIVTDAGLVIGTGTPVDTPLPPTSTVVPAPNDNDSAQAPAIDIAFTAAGTRSLQFTSDVSSPTGDSDDWIQFTSFTSILIVELRCSGHGLLSLELLQKDQAVPNWGNMTCGESKTITTYAGLAYQIHVQATPSNQLNYTRFTVKIVSVP